MPDIGSVSGIPQLVQWQWIFCREQPEFQSGTPHNRHDSPQAPKGWRRKDYTFNWISALVQRFPLLRKKEVYMGKQKAAPPMRFEPSDFSTDKYRCVNVINLRDRCPVIIMASESCDPPYYRVVDGSLEMFYLSYSEAVDYCRQSGYMTQK